MKYKDLLFDADNTLFDFDQSSHLAFDDMLRTFGIEPTAEIYNGYKVLNATVWAELEQKKISMSTVKTKRWKLFWDKMGLKHDYLETNNIYLDFLVKHCFLLEETLSLLQYLKSNTDLRLHIITNGMKEAQRPRITKLKIEHFFDSITVSDEIGFAKPNQQFFDHVFSINPNMIRESSLVIGDGLHSDIQGGILYGLDTCWYNPGNKISDPAYTATYEINSLRKLKGLL